ncbi:NPP1 family protein [Thalassomonas viridans]|uniref:NPP1 family protein n=1 Tax=Thalassomonas viridans TaxID=137584 RepID=A0AAE9Z0Y4_9GAMM|nr:NPP1 family protein [Thalassomonas viridans]WDE03212.1 NPP1 family protein [Thalassomonas viridans]
MKNTTTNLLKLLPLSALIGASFVSQAADFSYDEKLDRAVDTPYLLEYQGNTYIRKDSTYRNNQVVESQAPVWDFDGDGCYAAAAFDRSGVANPGLKISGGVSENCHFSDFNNEANTYHRHACTEQNGIEYCANMYALYFIKDQASFWFGHRHDLEHVITWFTDGVMTHVSASAHGDYDTRTVNNVEFVGAHPAIVYHKDSILTHAFRFARASDVAEPEAPGAFLTPTIVSYPLIKGDGVADNAMFRQLINNSDFGSASFDFRNSNFQSKLNEFKPSGYPSFTSDSIHAYSGLTE